MNHLPVAYLDESELAHQAANSVEIFAELYRRYFPRIYNYVSYRCDDPITADDLVAQIFERLLRVIDSYRPERGPFSAWLFAIARNEINAFYRYRRRRSWLSLDNLPQEKSREAGPEQQVVQREMQADLLRAISRLGERERDILGLKFAAQLNNRQIAALAGLSESNVGVIIHRALSRLRAELNGDEPSAEVHYRKSSHE
jgi:RNA polymerase sigma factor (sigma-70 family)